MVPITDGTGKKRVSMVISTGVRDLISKCVFSALRCGEVFEGKELAGINSNMMMVNFVEHVQSGVPSSVGKRWP